VKEHRREVDDRRNQEEKRSQIEELQGTPNQQTGRREDRHNTEHSKSNDLIAWWEQPCQLYIQTI
jgi:hypothetical protein